MASCVIIIKRRRDRTPKVRPKNFDSANRRAATGRWRKSRKPLCYPLPQLYAPASSIAPSSTGSSAVPIFWPYGIKRPELEKAIEALGPGDVLVLAEWDRTTRSMLDGIRIIERVAARGATFKALDRQWLDLTTPLGKGILAFLSALAEDERGRILARANGGRAAAKKRGVKFGPKPKLAAHQQREAVRMVREGQSLRAVAHHYHVGHSTIVRALERAS